jgi:hypothetical protein
MSLFFLATSCVKVGLNETNHPTGGKIVSLTTNWDNRGESLAIPSNYRIMIGDNSSSYNWEEMLSGVTNTVENLFPASTYHINIWNTTDNITISGTTATADYDAGSTGWFFTGTENITIEADKDYNVTVNMQQQVRLLTFELDIQGDAKDRLTDIDATFSGVAGAININNGNPTGNPATVGLDFVITGGKYVAQIRLFGITGNEQNLSLTLHFEDGNPSTHTVTSDISSQLKAFNADRKTPFTLSSILAVTPSETGYTAIISDWENNDGAIIAN